VILEQDFFLLKQYSNKIKSLRFIYSNSTPLMSFIFDLIKEDLSKTVRGLNRMKRNDEQNETLTESRSCLCYIKQ